MRHSFRKQVRAPTVRSAPDLTSYSSRTCVRIPVSYVELDSGNGVPGKGAVPLPRLSSLEAVLPATDAGYFILIRLCHRRCTCQATSSFSPYAGIPPQTWQPIHCPPHHSPPRPPATLPA